MVNNIESEDAQKDKIEKNSVITNVLKNPDLAKIFSYEELQSLLTDIDHDTIEKYAAQALLWLIIDRDPNDINTDIVQKKIRFLEENHTTITTQKSLEDIKEEIKNKNSNRQKISQEEQEDRDKIKQKIDTLSLEHEEIKKQHPINKTTANRKFFLEINKTNKLEQILTKNNVNIDQYLEMRYSAEQLIKSQENLTPETISFISQFNTLNTSLNIDYQIDIPTESMQFANKPKNLGEIIKSPDSVLAYEGIRNYTQTQPNIIEKPNETIKINPKLQQDIRSQLPDTKKETIINQIQDSCRENKLPSPVILSQGDSRRRRIQDTNEIHNPFDIEKLEWKETDIQTIIDTILQPYSQEYLLSQTNTLLQKQVMLQAVNGLVNYFDTTTSPQSNYASDFDLSDNGNIDIENNMLHISGKMDGQIVHFFYNLETGELQANDYLYKVMREDTFHINDIQKGRVSLPTHLPTIKTLQKTAKISYEDYAKTADTRWKYQSNLSKRAINKISEEFPQRQYNKTYIEYMNEKNLFIQTSLDIIGTVQVNGQELNMNNNPTPITLNKSLNPTEYAIMAILDRTSKQYRSPDELRTLRHNIQILNSKILSDPIQYWEHVDPVINKLFKGLSSKEDSEKKKNLLTLFDLISRPNGMWWSVIQSNDLARFIDSLSKPKEKLSDQNYPLYFQSRYEKILQENMVI